MTDPKTVRRVTLSIARTKIEFREGRVIELYRRMALNALNNSKTAGDISDSWSQEYDRMWPEMEVVTK